MIADVLRKAIRESGLSQTELAKRTRIPQPAISLFLKGGDMQLRTAKALVDFFGLELATADDVPPKKPSGRISKQEKTMDKPRSDKRIDDAVAKSAFENRLAREDAMHTLRQWARVTKKNSAVAKMALAVFDYAVGETFAPEIESPKLPAAFGKLRAMIDELEQ